MFSLNVLKDLDLTEIDGRIFVKGHACGGLSRQEVFELVQTYPDHFEAADDVTTELLKQLSSE